MIIISFIVVLIISYSLQIFIRSIRIKRNQNYISLRKDWRNDFNCRKNRVKICNKSILKIHTCKSVIANCSDKPSQLQIALDPSNKVIPLGFVPIAAPFDSILTWLNPFLFFLSLNNAASSHRIRFFIFYFFSPPSLSLSLSLRLRSSFPFHVTIQTHNFPAGRDSTVYPITGPRGWRCTAEANLRNQLKSSMVNGIEWHRVSSPSKLFLNFHPQKRTI